MVKAAQPIPGFRRVKGGEVFMWILNWHGLFIRLITLVKEKRTEQEVKKLFQKTKKKRSEETIYFFSVKFLVH